MFTASVIAVVLDIIAKKKKAIKRFINITTSSTRGPRLAIDGINNKYECLLKLTYCAYILHNVFVQYLFHILKPIF